MDKRKRGDFLRTAEDVIPLVPPEGISSKDLKAALIETGVSDPTARRTLRRLFSAGTLVKGEHIHRNVYMVKKAELTPVELTPSQPERIVVSKSLCLGEMAFGTKAYEPDAMTGLALWMDETRRTDINNVFLIGALVPRIPAFYSVSGSEDMRFLGNDPEKSESEDLETLLREANLKKSDANYFRDFVDRKILTMKDALTVVNRELGKLENVLGDEVEWHVQHGGEDQKNIQQAKELLITGAAKKRTDLSRYTNELEELEDKITGLKKRTGKLNLRKEIFSYIHNRVIRVKRKGAELVEYLKEVAQDAKDNYEVGIRSDLAKAIDSILCSGKNLKQVKDYYPTLKGELESLSTEVRDATLMIEETKNKIDSVNRQMEAWGFFSVTKRLEVRPDEEEIFFRLAKTRYNDWIYEYFPGDKKRLHVHSSREKKIEIPSLVQDSDPINSANALCFLLMHNPNHLNSNVPTKKDLVDLKEEAKEIAKLYRFLKQEVPDVFLSSHGKGGFRFQPQLKHRETVVAGEFVDDAGVVLHMKLPTFQSIPLLYTLKQRGVKTEHTKRFAAKDYASGAVIHTAYNDGTFDIEYIDVHTLTEFAKVDKQLQLERQILGMLDQEGDDDSREVVQSNIYTLEKKLKKWLNFKTKKVEARGDSHIGASTVPGRISQYDYVEACEHYQRENGLPDILILSEELNAPIGRVVDSNQQFWGVVPANLERMLAKETSRTDISEKEKIRRLTALARTQLHATPISHQDLIVEEWRERSLPYVNEILDKNGQVIVASGNHYNKSGGGRDEATALGNAILASRPDCNESVYLLKGIGEGQGLGEVRLEDGTKFYVAHKLRSGKDEILPAFAQIRGAGIDADYVFSFDRHHAAGGVADGSIFTLAPARQSWNIYVDEIGKLSSTRGLMNVDISVKEDGFEPMYAKWSLALNPTLETEKYMPYLIKDLNFK